MKKLLFTILALMVLGTSAWATTITKETKNMGWTAGKTYQSFNLDDVVLITTSGKGSSYSNGYFTSNNWYMYYNTGTSTNGPITISAKRGYKIDSYSLKYSPNGNATLSKVKGNNVGASNQIKSDTTYTVNAQSTTIYVGDKSTATSSIVKVTKFTVNYSKVDPTSIALSDMTISVGNTFQLLPTPTPANAYPSYTWSSDNTDVVSFDSNGILTAKKAGSANVTITSYNSKKATCKITVENKNYKSFTDTIKAYTTGSSYVGMTSVESVTGDGGVLNWIMRGVRRYTDDKVNNVQWTRICFNTTEDYLGKNYIAYNNSKGLPAEGGVKRVSFQWKAANGTNPVAFDVDNTGTPSPWITYKTYLNGNNAWKNVSTYTRDVNMDKNVQFRISLTANEAAVITISPITITPYLLFTNKAVTATNGFYKYNDNDLINNTGENPTITVSDANAASVDEDGTVRSLQDGKTVTVTAKWGDVTTTTKLTTKLIDPAGSFALGAAVITKNIGDDDFDNAFTKTVGDAFTYVSTNEDVATVDENGKVHIVNGGTTQIKAVFAASAPYKAKEFAYTLDVAHTPTEAYFAETFDSIPVGTNVSLDNPKVFGGNGGVYRWQWKNTQRLESEKIDTYQSPKIINNYGEIAMTDVAEGGIKEVAFRYKTKNSGLRFHFYVKVGDKEVEMARVGSADVMSFAHQFNMDDSVGLSIYQKATDSSQQTHLLIDTVKIVPYLLYTKKVAAASAADGAYTNLNLINNTGVKPSYSISCGSDVATIDENGAVTIYKSDTVTVTATWGKVKTTYTLQMQAKQIPVISFAEESLNKDLLAGKFTNQLTKPDGVGEISYSSNNEDVATVDASGEVTMHSIGEAKITVNITESEKYAATSKSYDLTVGFAPAAGTYWTETFKAAPQIKNYTGTDKYEGDSSVYNWAMTFYQRQSDDMVGTYQGTRVRYSGALAMDGVQEGGIKAVRFDYRAANQTDSIHFKVNVGNTDYEYKHDAITVKGTIVSYARKFEVKKNAQFSINMDAKKDPQQGYPIVGPITITPYLLYTEKADTISIADYATAKYSNLNLINNIDEGSVAYSIIESTPADIASIEDATKGDITINAGGVIKVQAKWGDVTTTYTLKINKIAPEVKFAKSSIDTTMNAETVTNDFTAPAGAGAITYKSSDARIAKVDAEGVVAVVGAGTVTITADVAENETFEAASTSYTLNITDPEEFALEESFPNYAGSPWTSNAQVGPVDVIGELDTWSISYARHRITPKDSLLSGERAVWFNTNGYIETTSSLEGGIKRVQFNYNKVKTKKDFSVIAGDIRDTITAAALNTDYNYNHNFFFKKNATLKIHNITSGDFLVGTIKVTPYLYFSLRGDTIKASDYIGKEPYIIEGLKNNTGSSDIIYSSSNPEVAQVNNGEVTVYADAAEPVIITAAWAASETDTVTTTFSLQINGKDQREASFAQDSVTIARGETPENTLNITPIEGETTPTVAYESSNEEVAKIGANNTVITVGPGTAIITAKIGATDKCLAGEASYVLTVTYTPTAGTFWKETFSNAGNIQTYMTETKTIKGDDGTANKWAFIDLMRPTSDYVGTERGIRIRYNGSITNNVALEGGIKEVVFNWRPLNTAFASHFYVQVGDSMHSISYPKVVDAQITLPYAHSFGAEGKTSNASLKIGNYAKETPTEQGYVVIGEVNVLPYLLYTTKKDTLDMKVKKTYQMIPQIDNRDDEVAIEYSIIAGNENSIAQIAADGTVTANASGTITVQAAWSGVTTTYQLTILADKTTIYLVRNDGTENVDTIVNNRDEVAPTINLPVREGYKFNAYWTKPDTATGSYRFTVTTANGVTGWVSNRTINKEKVTGDERIWIYKGSQYTLYADWRAERTITLDNQEATEAGTDKVVTAYCPNNNMLRLTTSITCPTKTGYAFAGYYTEADGQGAQLIDATGAFKASVAGYTDKDRWFIKDADINLYAYWVENVLTIDEEDTELAQKVADNDGKSANVTLRRAMTADGTYNTIYLPFALNEDQVTTVFGANAKVAELTSSSLDGNVLSLNFDFVTATEAGKPYLVAPTKDVTEVNVGQVAISKDEQESTCEGGNFHGILAAQNIAMSGKYFLGNENKLITYTAINNYDTKGLRAYFTLYNPAPGVQARCVIGRGTTTILPFINGEAVSGTKKVIKDNQLIIIRDGKMFNAQGACLQ